MSLFELQAWLGHRSPTTTQSYVAIAPTKLAKAYAAGYLARNVRAIEVFIDSDVVKNPEATSGEPWRYYDLGHCFCTTSSLISVHIEWPVPGVTSVSLKVQAVPNLWNPKQLHKKNYHYSA